MTKHTAPAADEGLPNSSSAGSILMETEHGLSVCRPLKSLKTSFLPAESSAEFMSLLDRYVEAGEREEFVRGNWKGIGHESRCAAIDEANFKKKDTRRDLIRHLKKIRAAPAKTLDDILFKAEICAVLEPWDVRDRRGISHSVIADLLSAGCTWMQPSPNE